MCLIFHFIHVWPSLSLQMEEAENFGRGGGCCPSSAGCLVLPVSRHCVRSPTSVSPGVLLSPFSSCRCTSRLAAVLNASETSCCFWDRYTTEGSAWTVNAFFFIRHPICSSQNILFCFIISTCDIVKLPGMFTVKKWDWMGIFLNQYVSSFEIKLWVFLFLSTYFLKIFLMIWGSG